MSWSLIGATEEKDVYESSNGKWIVHLYTLTGYMEVYRMSAEWEDGQRCVRPRFTAGFGSRAGMEASRKVLPRYVKAFCEQLMGKWQIGRKGKVKDDSRA